MLTTPYQVRHVTHETHDTFTLELTPEYEACRLAFRPGQFNMLYLYGVGEVPISISGDPAHPDVLTHTTREVGTVTHAMAALKKGDAIGVRGPYGTAWPMEEARGRDVIIVAGGIGLAPLRPALYELIRNRNDYGKVVLLYGTRSPQDILYAKELQGWRAKFDMEIYVTVDRAMGAWRGNVGVVTTLIPRAPFNPPNTVAMVCGPEIMMRFTVQELLRRGVPETSVYVSMERNMKCGVAACGHCQCGPHIVCRDGPVFRYDVIAPVFHAWEV